MKIINKGFFGILLILLIFSSGIVYTQKNTQYQNQPLNKWARYKTTGFTENKGQFDRTADGKPILPEHSPLLVANLKGYDFFLTKRGFSFLFYKIQKREEKPRDSLNVFEYREESVEYKYNRIDFNFRNITLKKENIQFEESDEQGVTNYYYGNCIEGVTDIKSYQRAIVRNVYKNIDLILYGNDTNGIKYEFLVKPGGNTEDIDYDITGTEEIKIIDNSTKIVLSSKLTKFQEGPLNVYYEDNNKNINAQYVLKERNNIKLKLENYDKKKSIVIDPIIIPLWSTMYGGLGLDGPRSIKSDQFGNVFVCGYLTGTTFPTYNPGNGAYFEGASVNSGDAFIIKFNNNGQRLWATYIGGNLDLDIANEIAVSHDGNVFIVGTTSASDFPLFQSPGKYFNGQFNNTKAFIFEADNTGHRLWATFYGGSSFDFGSSINIGLNGNIFVAGTTFSSDINVYTDNTYSFTHGPYGGIDVFVVAFNNNCNKIWSTYIGGSGDDTEYNSPNNTPCIITDNTGNIFVVYNTHSNDIIPTGVSPAFLWPYKGGYDGQILKFSNTGAIVWQTYFGGMATIEAIQRICIDNNNNIIVSGITNFENGFPIINCNEGQIFSGGYDAFLAKFTNQGELLWSRFYGGLLSENNITYTSDIEADINGNIYFTGGTSSSNLPILNPGECTICNSSLNGNNDAYLTIFNPSGTVKFGAYLGSLDGTSGWVNEFGRSLCFDIYNNLFLTGEIGSQMPASFFIDPGNNAYMQTQYSGSDDMFIIKFATQKVKNCCEDVLTNIVSKSLTIYSNGNSNLSLGIASSPNAINKVDVQILSASRMKYSKNKITNIVTTSGPYNIPAEIVSAPNQIGQVPKLNLNPLLPQTIESVWNSIAPTDMSSAINISNINIKFPPEYASNNRFLNWDSLTVCIRVMFTDMNCLRCYKDVCITKGRYSGPPEYEDKKDL